MHLVSQGVCLSIAGPDGRALINCVSKSRAANADFEAVLEVSGGL